MGCMHQYFTVPAHSIQERVPVCHSYQRTCVCVCVCVCVCCVRAYCMCHSWCLVEEIAGTHSPGCSRCTPRMCLALSRTSGNQSRGSICYFNYFNNLTMTSS